MKRTMKKNLAKIYLKSPRRVQIALAKYGIKSMLNKKKAQLLKILPS